MNSFLIPRIARIVIPEMPHHITQRGNNCQVLNNVTRGYTSNDVNEYTQITADSVNQGVLYDDRGNLSHDDGYDNTNADHFAYEYDVNNQLTEVSYDPGTGLTALATYRYDNLGPS